MHPQPLYLPLVLAGLFALLVGCNATHARIQDHEELFATYDPTVQAMIRSNRIGLGFDTNQVYLALGKADRTALDGDREVWTYLRRHRRQIEEEKSATEYAADLAEYRAQVASGSPSTPGAGVPAPPGTHRVIQLTRMAVAFEVRFEHGRVTGWSEPEERWVEPWQRQP